MFFSKQPAAERRCSQCRGRMQEGAVMERASSVRTEQVWVATEPLPPEAKGVHVSRPFPVRAMRCTRCGFLAFFAS